MKQKIMILIYACPFLLMAEAATTTIALKKEKPDSLIYEGTVSFAQKNKIAFEEKGKLVYVAPPGVILSGEIHDSQGKVVVPGAIIAKQDPSLQKHNLDLAKVYYNDKLAVLEERTEAYNRDQQLQKNNIISEKEYLESKVAYERAALDCEQAEIGVAKAQYALDSCTIRAPFTCVINNIYYNVGAGVDAAQDVLEIVQVSPMKVTVQLPQALTAIMDLTCTVSVCSASGEVCPAFFALSNVHTDRLECFVLNPLDPVVSGLATEEQELPEIRELSFVLPQFSEGTQPHLWVDSEALQGDENEQFVWKLKNSKAFNADAPVGRTDTVMKVPVKVLDMEVSWNMRTLRAVTDDGALKPNDYLVGEVTRELKDNEEIVYSPLRRRFRPDEKVKVEIKTDRLPEGFYVPRQAVYPHVVENISYVLVQDGEQKRMIPVESRNAGTNTVRIISPELQEGMSLIVKNE